MYWILLPFALIYGLIIVIRNKLFDKGFIKSHKFNIPIINVGNITVGGTGKTPHIEYLIDILKDKYSLATISRGYGRKTKGYINVQTNANALNVGDEPLQIKQKFNTVKVIVDEKRVNAINKINKDVDIILLDDAYQHRHVTPGLNILLINYNRLITNDFMLPAGRLREPAYEKKRADIIIISKCPDNITPIQKDIIKNKINPSKYQKLLFSGFKYKNPISIFNPDVHKNINELKNLSVLVVTGIANPQPLYSMLEENNINITKLRFNDHHNFSDSDIHKIIKTYNAIPNDDKIIICTEKDTVRLLSYKNVDDIKQLPIYHIPVTVDFFEDNLIFNDLISNYINNESK
jgi:tetraacyldisaccharide 4'-kinase